MKKLNPAAYFKQRFINIAFLITALVLYVHSFNEQWQRKVHLLTDAGSITFALALVFLVLGSINYKRIKRQKPKKAKTKRWISYPLILSLIIILAYWLRAINVLDMPAWTDGDDHSAMMHGLNLLHLTGIKIGSLESAKLDIFSSTGDGKIQISFLPYSIMYLIFGATTFAVRYANVLIGTGLVFVTYLIGKELWNKKIGLVASFLCAVSVWGIGYSRIGLDNIFSSLVGAIAVWLYLRASRLKTLLSAVLFGIALAGCMYVYSAAKVIVVIFAIVLVTALIKNIFKRKFSKSLLKLAIVGLISFIVALTPIIIRFTYEPGVVSDRTASVSIFNEKNLESYKKSVRTTGLVDSIAISSIKAFDMFKDGDESVMFGYKKGLLDTLSRFFFVIGIVLLLVLKNKNRLLLLLWFVLTILIGNGMTVFPSAPYSPRLVGLIPLLAIITAYGLVTTADFARRRLKERRKPLVNAVVIAILVSIAMTNLQMYFVEYASGFYGGDSIKPYSAIGRYINQNKQDSSFIILENGWGFWWHSSIVYMYAMGGNVNPQRPVPNVTQVKKIEELNYQALPSGNIKLLFAPNIKDFELIKSIIPGGKVQVVTDFAGRAQLCSYSFVK